MKDSQGARAAATTMHEAVWDWLLTCPYIGELFLNFATAHPGGTVLVPLAACRDNAEVEFVDGSSIRNYDFELIRFCLYSAAPSGRENLDALSGLSGLASWIEAQGALGNYPTLPAGCTPLNVEVLPGDGMPGAWDEGGAHYIMQVRIRYEKE